MRGVVVESAPEALAALESGWKALVIGSEEKLLVETYRAVCQGEHKSISIRLPGAIVVVIPEPG